ncbi:MAG: hypothetical protein EOP07_11835 [Proteobacteria bacterium]|nr:MAG: hypothetical protein EOP07_11835 [Pseudomonadota bacterium]
MSASDWFQLGLDDNIGAGLDKVLREEEMKIQFVRSLKAALHNPIPYAPDRLRQLHDDIRTLDKTLRIRVGVLPLDRPQAWFRSSPSSEKNPIAGIDFTDPIFMPFDESHALTLKNLIPEYWKQRVVATDRYDPGLSLWGRLLILNKRLHHLNVLPAPFQDIALDEMPDAIPDIFATPSLAQFGLQIAERVKAARRDLDACYAFLWSRSQSFLYALHVHYMAQKARGAFRAEDSFKEASERSDAGAKQAPPIPKRKMSPLEEALHFMSFQRLPSFADLRQRYRTMAQALHPDRGGCEERFKQLTLHYQALLKQLQRF